MPSSQYPSSERTAKVSRRAFLLAAGGGVTVGNSRVAARLRNTSTVRIDGTPAHLPLSNDVREVYESPKNPPLSVDAHGTSSAIRRFVAGETDLLFGGRPMTSEERALAKSRSVSFSEFEVVVGGAMLANLSNQWQQSLRSDQLTDAWHTGSEWITWAELTETNAAEFMNLPTIARSKSEGARPRLIPINSGTTSLVHGTREHQYSEGEGGLGYYKVDTDNLHPIPRSASLGETKQIPLVGIAFAYVNKDALRRSAIAILVQTYNKTNAEMVGDIMYYSILNIPKMTR